MSKPSPVTFDSTLANVVSHDFEVTSTTLGQVVAQKFAQNLDLPGVIVTDNSHLLGMISRTQFREKINHSQQKDIYLNHPIQFLLDYLRTPPLLLSKDCQIIDAVKTILNRNKELIYEPIIVVFDQDKHRLIDVQDILLAQNRLVYKAQVQIEEQQSKLEESLQLVELEKKKCKEYFFYYKKQEKSLKSAYKYDLESKQKEWFKSVQKINQIYQEFKSVSQLVVTETSQVFSSISTSANLIQANDQPILEVSQSISRDLETIELASNMISNLLKQIHHLSVQASIIVHQAHTSSQGYSKINSEINKMINEIITCNQQISKIATHFKFNVQKLQEVADNNEELLRAIYSKIQRGEMVIQELAQLVNQDEHNLTFLTEIPDQQSTAPGSGSLQSESEPIETDLNSNNPTLVSNYKNLIQIIDLTLKKQSLFPSEP